ncbi:MAG: glycoside hydrolase family 3 C-terminal domain-containing protein [Clostridia bacterium]|nr:glycoside hydrolase family 3 C-terminal domain-containing protein [Clostridia bacterium]
MEKWARIKYHPCLPLGDNNSKITGCEKHIQLSREAACEGTVLLKNNDNVLPLKKGTKVAIFGKAQIDYVKGGGGSGIVYCEYVRNIYEGLKQKTDIEIFDSLSLYYKDYVEAAYKSNEQNGRFSEAEIPEELVKSAAKFTDTAIITINRYSGEGWDRKGDGTDPYFELSVQEKNMVNTVCDNFDKIIVLLNTGAMIDTSWFADNNKIQGAIMIWQGGMEGGLAASDILVGDVTPSGKLVDTCAISLADYPSSAGFHESDDYVKYTEDIFVGYRYFETIPGMKERVVYPFGYGLSYTKFEIKNALAHTVGNKILVSADVKNVGKYRGKEVVQIYYGAPEGKITKPARELCAFAKTKLLSPGESETLIMSFNISDMASYDDMGDIEKSAYVMEAGEYKIYVGTSVRDAKEIEFRYELKENKICQKLTEYCKPTKLGKRLTATGEYIDVPDEEYTPKSFTCTYECDIKIPTEREAKKQLIDVVNEEVSLDEFISQLSDNELLSLLVGQKSTGVADTDGMGNLPEYGIPAPMTVDGPAGVRISPYTGVRTTAFPVATMLACTWNTDILERIGIAGALETKENNLSMWLTPALNIHRSPLCGRNFEYYSEDPFVSGKMAAAMVRGIQSQRIVATPKHFACNNKETNRKESNSIVSERALREIYLKGFEICVKESEPKLIMTAYNIVNNVRTSENAELITGILRGEWGYKGLVTTDWWNTAEKSAEVKAGNDIRMPSSANDGKQKYIDTISVKNTRNELAVCVKRLLEMILWLE